MDPNKFDSVIAGLAELGAKIASINARPFMPDPNINFSRVRTKTIPAAEKEPAVKPGLSISKRLKKSGSASKSKVKT